MTEENGYLLRIDDSFASNYIRLKGNIPTSPAWPVDQTEKGSDFSEECIFLQVIPARKMLAASVLFLYLNWCLTPFWPVLCFDLCELVLLLLNANHGIAVRVHEICLPDIDVDGISMHVSFLIQRRLLNVAPPCPQGDSHQSKDEPHHGNCHGGMCSLPIRHGPCHGREYHAS